MDGLNAPEKSIRGGGTTSNKHLKTLTATGTCKEGTCKEGTCKDRHSLYLPPILERLNIDIDAGYYKRSILSVSIRLYSSNIGKGPSALPNIHHKQNFPALPKITPAQPNNPQLFGWFYLCFLLN